MVNTTSRVAVFKAVYDCINADPPTYTDRDGNTATYTVLSSFPEVDPVYPCLVINPLIKRTRSLGVKWTGDRKSAKGEVDIEFFAKTRDGKNAIDSARDHVEELIDALQSSAFFLISENPFEDTGVDIVDYNDQKLNTAMLTVNMVIR